MCKRPDCPNPGKAAHLRHVSECEGNPLFNAELDLMPDGFHAKPMRLWAAKPQKRRIPPSVNEYELNEIHDQIRKRWEQLPDPKPDPMDFAAQETRWDQWFELYKISRTAEFAIERIKAASTLLEFAKGRPKQQLEITGKEQDVDLDRLLQRICELKQIPPEVIAKLIGNPN